MAMSMADLSGAATTAGVKIQDAGFPGVSLLQMSFMIK